MNNTPDTKLARLIHNKDRWETRARDKGPIGAPQSHWEAWRAWIDARRGAYAAAIRAAREEKRFNQRSKADERKYSQRTSPSGAVGGNRPTGGDAGTAG